MFSNVGMGAICFHTFEKKQQFAFILNAVSAVSAVPARMTSGKPFKSLSFSPVGNKFGKGRAIFQVQRGSTFYFQIFLYSSFEYFIMILPGNRTIPS